MKKTARQIAVLSAALILFCALCRLTVFRTYNIVFTPPEGRMISARISEGDEFLRLGPPRLQGGSVRIPVEGLKPGDACVDLTDEADGDLGIVLLHISPLGTVYNSVDGSFTGDSAVLIAVTLFWLLTSLIMAHTGFTLKGPAFYSYASIYTAGFSIFSLVSGLLMLTVTVRHLIDPAGFSMLSAYSTVSGAPSQFLLVTSPAVVAFAAAMAVSNVFLLRKNTPRLQNVLGLLVSALLLGGLALAFYLDYMYFSGSEWEYRLRSTAVNVFSTVFVYFECMLAGSVISGYRAARHQPAPDKDFIIILGCWFRPDGTLPPLLRGRVDRALGFWRMQKEKTGREAVLIPSGGQGANETMPEAEAMRRYLLEQQIPAHLILPETRSRNTYENMAFSRAIIEARKPGARVIFATTNYHVFRSGVWAANAGLKAEGIGGKTKWWFWPNAFMREVVGLLQHRWKQELALLGAMVGFFALLSMTLY